MDNPNLVKATCVAWCCMTSFREGPSNSSFKPIWISPFVHPKKIDASQADSYDLDNAVLEAWQKKSRWGCWQKDVVWGRWDTAKLVFLQSMWAIEDEQDELWNVFFLCNVFSFGVNSGWKRQRCHQHCMPRINRWRRYSGDVSLMPRCWQIEFLGHAAFSIGWRFLAVSSNLCCRTCSAVVQDSHGCLLIDPPWFHELACGGRSGESRAGFFEKCCERRLQCVPTIHARLQCSWSHVGEPPILCKW